jgi:hypothetical protein
MIVSYIVRIHRDRMRRTPPVLVGVVENAACESRSFHGIDELQDILTQKGRFAQKTRTTPRIRRWPAG